MRAVLALLAAGTQAETRTKVLPGNGYIRYQVLPGDDEQPPGELLVTHADRSAPPAPAPPAAAPGPVEEPPPPPRADRCAPLRAKLLARLFEMRGLEIEPQLAEWLERNLQLGSRSLFGLSAEGEPLIVIGVKTDGVVRMLAEDLARCEG
ncbi:MAG: hypothetical protein ACXWLM_07440 [Myxococcales bacterium]